MMKLFDSILIEDVMFAEILVWSQTSLQGIQESPPGGCIDDVFDMQVSQHHFDLSLRNGRRW